MSAINNFLNVSGFNVGIFSVISLSGSSKMAHNGLALGAVADFGAQNCQYTTKADAR
jgi:hypothetical protein